MPCICYRATSGKEDIDDFIKSGDGKKVMEYMKNACDLIKSHKIPEEVIDMSIIEFRQEFVKGFLHMLIGCDEEGKPKI